MSCGSSSGSDEGLVDRIPAPKPVTRSRSKAKPESVKVKTQSEKNPARNCRQKTAPKVPIKRKTPTDRLEGQSTPKVTVIEEPDALDESADKSGPSGRGARPIIVSLRLYYFDNKKVYLVPLGVR